MFKKLIVILIVSFLLIPLFLPLLLQGVTILYVLFINPGKSNFERRFADTAKQYLAIPETFSVISNPLPLYYFYPPYFPLEYAAEGPVAKYYDDFYGRLEWEDDFGKYSLVYRPFYGDKTEILLSEPVPNFPFIPKNNKEYIATLMIKTKDSSFAEDNIMGDKYCLKKEHLGKIQNLLTHLFKRDIIVKLYPSCALAYFYNDSTQHSSINIYFDKTMNMNVNNITKVWYNSQNIHQYDERF